MFLKSKRFVCPAYINISKRLLSNEIKEVFNTRLHFPNTSDGKNLQLAAVSKTINAIHLDLFVNNLSSQEDRSSDVLDLVAKLRATKLTNTCLESTHFGVVRHLLENLTIQELVPVLLDRPKYGIFLNNFTGFAVIQTLYEEKEYILGLPLALKLVLSEEVDSVFVHGFCLKSSLETLTRESFGDNSPDEKAISQRKGKVQEKKIRVKFLRNIEEPDLYNEMGKAILKIESRILEGNMRANAKILGLVLTKNYSELDKALTVNDSEINEDIADICKKVLLRDNQESFADKICKLRSKMSFKDSVDKFLKEASKESASLAEKQKLLLPIWQEQRAQQQLDFEKEVTEHERKENIKATENEIATKKELLWFFDQEEKLDLEIYNKRVFYPKRWFGKKKKPRVVDDHYVPPQIRKIN